MSTARACIDQVITNLTYGDAVATSALTFQTILRDWGYDSRIWALRVDDRLAGDGWRADLDSMRARRLAAVIFHYSTYSPALELVEQLASPLLLVYHNVTPPSYFYGWNDVLAEAVRRGRYELPRLAEQTAVAVAFSELSRRDLVAAGYRDSRVIPFGFDSRDHGIAPDEAIVSRWSSAGWVNLLFVGRLAPNKRHDKLLEVYYYYKRRIEPQSRLFFVGGDEGMSEYRRAVEGWIERWRLADVYLTGHVTMAELDAYYRVARVFLCVSDHEGFGVPLLEAMHHGVPVIAYANAAVPETLGGAGILVRDRDPAYVAEIVHLLATDRGLRARVVAGQRDRLRAHDREALAGALAPALKTVLSQPIAR
ncbi:MAG: glycosyltransferase family 4 protein [Chloroflexi bacterium]|nr:glycosyltransferase family 4 protein [Chloroflexota bacterium]